MKQNDSKAVLFDEDISQIPDDGASSSYAGIGLAAKGSTFLKPALIATQRRCLLASRWR